MNKEKEQVYIEKEPFYSIALIKKQDQWTTARSCVLFYFLIFTFLLPLMVFPGSATSVQGSRCY